MGVFKEYQSIDVESYETGDLTWDDRLKYGISN